VCSSLEFLRGLEKEVESEWPRVQAALEEIRATVACREGAIVNLTGTRPPSGKAEGPVNGAPGGAGPRGPRGASRLRTGPSSPRANEGLIVPTQVRGGGGGWGGGGVACGMLLASCQAGIRDVFLQYYVVFVPTSGLIVLSCLVAAGL